MLQNRVKVSPNNACAQAILAGQPIEAAHLAAETKRWGKIIRERDIKAD